MSNEKLKPVFKVAPEVLRLVNGQIREMAQANSILNAENIG